jgi:hypothetical protein
MKESYLENEYVELWVENGIIMEIFKPHIKDITLEMAKTVVRDRLIVSNKVNMPIFIDMGNLRSISKEARDYFVTEVSISYLSASAVVLNSYTSWILGKLFMSFSKPILKVELFKSRSKAMEWLQQFVPANQL